jgi:hypothetical protein
LPWLMSYFAVAILVPVGPFSCVVRLSVPPCWPVGSALDGAGEPVQIGGWVPGEVAGGWFGLHALISAAEATRGINAVAAANLRLRADLSLGRAYLDDDAGRNDPVRSGIKQPSSTTMRVGTTR